MGVNKWAHLNCALWSTEVYETCNGALMNVEEAYVRGQATECCVCRQVGATLGCFKARCTNRYHLPCARLKECMFFQDKVRFVTICGFLGYVVIVVVVRIVIFIPEDWLSFSQIPSSSVTSGMECVLLCSVCCEMVDKIIVMFRVVLLLAELFNCLFRCRRLCIFARISIVGSVLLLVCSW